MTIATVCQILVPELGTMLSAFYALSYLIIPIPYSISILQIRGLLLIDVKPLVPNHISTQQQLGFDFGSA